MSTPSHDIAASERENSGRRNRGTHVGYHSRPTAAAAMKLNTAAAARLYGPLGGTGVAALSERPSNTARNGARVATATTRVGTTTARSMSTDPAAAPILTGSPRADTERPVLSRPSSARPGSARPGTASDPSRVCASTRRGSADQLSPFGFEALGPIASGAFSQVVRGRHTATRREVAIKSWTRTKLARAPHHLSAMKSELAVLKLLQPSGHQHIANMVEVLESRSAVHLVLEYACGGSLHRYMQSRGNPNLQAGVGSGLHEEVVAALMSQLAAALMHMHGLGVAHRDLKPENVLFTDASHTQVKLCDFGFAVRCGERRLRTVCGSAQYMAPELHTPVGEGYLGMPVDMWALGALLYEMLHGKPAFRGVSMEQLKLRILRVSNEPFASGCSAGARSLVGALLQQNAEARLTARDVLTHAWLPSYSI